MTDQQKLLLELTKTVQLQTKLLETQIKQCISTSLPLTKASTTASTTGTKMKHPDTLSDSTSTVSSSINPQKGELSLSSTDVNLMNPNRMENVSSSHQDIKKKVSKPMDMTQYEFVTSSESLVQPAVKVSSSKMLDLSVDSGIVPEMSNCCNKHLEEEEEETFLDKDGNVTTRKIECAKTVAKVESWLKGILTPPDAGNKVKDKKVTFAEPTNCANCDSNSLDECLDELKDNGEGKVDSTTEFNAVDCESVSDSDQEKFVHDDNAVCTRGSANLPYPFPTSFHQDVGNKTLEKLQKTSLSVESSKELPESFSTEAVMQPCFVQKQFPCPINWQTFLRPSSVSSQKNSSEHGNISMAVYPGLPQPFIQTRMPINFQPPLQLGFQPPLPPEDDPPPPPPPPPPPDHPPEEEIKQKDKKRSLKKKLKKKNRAAALEFSLQMSDPVGKVILEMSRHKLQQEQINDEYSVSSQFTPPALTHSGTKITPPFLPHLSPEINEVMPQQLATKVPCIMSHPQFGPANSQSNTGLLRPSFVPNGMQQPNGDLMATNGMQQPYTRPIIPNSIQQPNARVIVPNRMQNPSTSQMVPNSMHEPNTRPIISNRMQHLNTRPILPNRMHQPNTRQMVPNRMQQSNTRQVVPIRMQQPNIRQMVPNRMQQPNTRQMVPNHLIQNRMPETVSNGMQHLGHALGNGHMPNWMENQNVSEMSTPEIFSWQRNGHISSETLTNQTIPTECRGAISARLMQKAGYGYDKKSSVRTLQEDNPEECSIMKTDQYVWSPQKYQGKCQKFDRFKEYNCQNVGKRGKKRQKKQNEVCGNRKRGNYTAPQWNNLSGHPKDLESLSPGRMQGNPRTKHKTKQIPSLFDVNLAHLTSGMDDDFQSTKENRMSVDDMTLDDDLKCFFADQNSVREDFSLHLKSQSEIQGIVQESGEESRKKCVNFSGNNVEKGIDRNVRSSFLLQDKMQLINDCTHISPNPLNDLRCPVQVDKSNRSSQPAPPGVDDWN